MIPALDVCVSLCVCVCVGGCGARAREQDSMTPSNTHTHTASMPQQVHEAIKRKLGFVPWAVEKEMLKLANMGQVTSLCTCSCGSRVALT